MDILKSLMGNKSILNSALGMLRNAFLKEGVSAVFITPSDDPDSETPGMSIRQFSEPVAILTGAELAEVQQYYKIKAMHSGSPGYFLFMHEGLAYFPNYIPDNLTEQAIKEVKMQHLNDGDVESAKDQAVRMEREKMRYLTDDEKEAYHV